MILSRDFVKNEHGTFLSFYMRMRHCYTWMRHNSIGLMSCNTIIYCKMQLDSFFRSLYRL